MKREDQAKEALTMFDRYLEDHGISSTTRVGYVNAIAKMIGVYVKNDGNLTAQDLADYESALARTSRNLFRVAWKHFRAFCASEGTPMPPEVQTTPLGAARQDVADAARFISSQMSVKQIHRQRWDGVRYESGCVYVVSPDQSVFMFAGQHAIDAFQTLGQAYFELPKPPASYPLVPMRAFDSTPLSTTSLRLLIKRGKAIRFKEDVEIPPEIIALITSMLSKGVDAPRIMRALGAVYTQGVADPIVERQTATQAALEAELDEEVEEEVVDPEPAAEVRSARGLPLPMPTFAEWKKRQSSQD